jgi:hypothetical protein
MSTRNPAAMLRHPLVVGGVVAVVSGIVASLLVPAVTRSWQDRPRELALKRGLVERVSKTSADAVARANAFGFTAQTAARTGVKITRRRRVAFLAGALRRWDVHASAIGSELETYFPQTSIPRRWREYDFGMTTFLRYVSNAEVNTHAYLLSLLQEHFGSVRFKDRADERTRRDVAAGRFEAGQKRLELAGLLTLERDQVSHEVLEADAQGFSHRFWVFR